MRRPSPLGLAALGLVLSVSPMMARAQDPSTAATASRKPADPKDIVVDPANPATWNSRNTTALERRRMRRQQEVARVPMGVLTEAQAAEVRKMGPPRGWRPGMPATTPGAESVVVAASPGQGTVVEGCASCAAAASGMPGMMTSGPNGTPPGYAIVGATMPVSEPTPIGVMRTSYGSNPAGASSSMPGYASIGGGASGAGMGPSNGAIPPAVSPVPPAALRRPHIIAHVFGFSGRTPGQSIMDHRNSRERSQHAAIAYGANSSINELPSSVVYGR